MCSPGSFRLLLASVVIYDHLFGLLLGRAAVFLFFVLSGFWIHRMWTERYMRASHPYVTFLISRLWRLMPVMLTASAMAIGVQLLVLDREPLALLADGPAHVILSHLFLVGYSGLEASRLVQPAWSLDLEMQFYLVAPLLIFALSRLGGGLFVALCVALFLCDKTTDTPAALHALGWFAIGMLASAYAWRPTLGVVWASTLATLGLLGFFAFSSLNLVLTDPALYDENTWLNLTLAALASPLALRTCFADEHARGKLCGDLSYIVYLIHWPLLAWTSHSLPAHPLAQLLSLLLLVPLSLAIWFGLDRPAQRARATWVTGRIEGIESQASCRASLKLTVS